MKKIISVLCGICVCLAANGYTQPGCFELAPNNQTYILNAKSNFDGVIKSMIDDPSSILQSQKYSFCQQFMDYEFYDLAKIACTDIDDGKLTDEQKYKLAYAQISIQSANLEFDSALSGVLKALEHLESDAEKLILKDEYLKLLATKLWLNYLKSPKVDQVDDEQKIEEIFESITNDPCSRLTASYIKSSTLNQSGNIVSDDISKLLNTFNDHSCHLKQENLILLRTFVYQHSPISVQEKIDNIKTLLERSQQSCDITTTFSLAITLFKLSYNEDPLAAIEFLNLAEQMVKYSGNLHSQLILSWNKAISDVVNGQSDKAIESFNSTCDLAKQKTSVDNKLLFGDFSFLSESDQSKVEDIYLQSSCAG